MYSKLLFFCLAVVSACLVSGQEYGPVLQLRAAPAEKTVAPEEMVEPVPYKPPVVYRLAGPPKTLYVVDPPTPYQPPSYGVIRFLPPVPYGPVLTWGTPGYGPPGYGPPGYGGEKIKLRVVLPPSTVSEPKGYGPPGYGPPGYAEEKPKLRALLQQSLVTDPEDYGPPGYGPPGYGPPGYGPPGYGGETTKLRVILPPSSVTDPEAYGPPGYGPPGYGPPGYGPPGYGSPPKLRVLLPSSSAELSLTTDEHDIEEYY